LRALYAQDKPLTLSASLAFEQSYGGIDGDSATAAEMYALLSAIANLPVRQDIAVTGSIDQRGQMQPVGSINEKIEGFFDVCRARGLTGSQGVLIPQHNVEDLMLRADVVSAVRRRRFHVYPVRDLDEGIPVLFAMRAGRRRRQRWERDTLHARVDDALFELVDGIKDFIDGNDTPARGDTGGLSDEDTGEVEVAPRRRRTKRPAAVIRARRRR
jgi:predicted ATP-dependent protease